VTAAARSPRPQSPVPVIAAAGRVLRRPHRELFPSLRRWSTSLDQIDPVPVSARPQSPLAWVRPPGPAPSPTLLWPHAGDPRPRPATILALIRPRPRPALSGRLPQIESVSPSPTIPDQDPARPPCRSRPRPWLRLLPPAIGRSPPGKGRRGR
jgi:hypothetical protein